MVIQPQQQAQALSSAELKQLVTEYFPATVLLDHEWDWWATQDCFGRFSAAALEASLRSLRKSIDVRKAPLARLLQATAETATALRSAELAHQLANIPEQTKVVALTELPLDTFLWLTGYSAPQIPDFRFVVDRILQDPRLIRAMFINAVNLHVIEQDTLGTWQYVGRPDTWPEW